MHNKILLPHKEISAGDVQLAIASAQLHVARASYHELTEMLACLPEHYRGRVTALLRDVLCGYPTMTWGIPVLIRVDVDDDPIRPIPLPLPEYQPPDTDVESCSWLSVRTLRLGERFGKQTDPVSIYPNRQECAVLLVRTRGEDPPQLSDEWWGDALRSVEGRITVSADAPIPWPDAVEAAAAMLANSRSPRGYVDTPQLFLEFGDYLAAQETGKKFFRRLAAEEGIRYNDDTPPAADDEI